MDNDHPQNDHDLLVVIHTTLKRALDDIKDLKDNFAARMTVLENNMVDKSTVVDHMKKDDEIQGDHETRLRRLEYGYFAMLGMVALIEFASRFLK